MKKSSTYLGQAIQFFLLKHGASMDLLASQMNISPDSLSNLIHGRRRFKNETLVKLAKTPLMASGEMTLTKLKAMRVMDEYSFEELLHALVEFIRQGSIEALADDFFVQFQAEIERIDPPASLAHKKLALLELARTVQR
ncbi:MAG: helix-turn-helix transcriptional regulator [Vampirovibrionales bacterium]|nr:helix-turn-helix transcriptional regulator [Vampirovibrionales bacterium]